MAKHKFISSKDKVLILRELLENRIPLNQLAEKYEIADMVTLKASDDADAKEDTEEASDDAAAEETSEDAE